MKKKDLMIILGNYFMTAMGYDSFMDEKEADAFLAHISVNPDLLNSGLKFMYLTGLRPEEVAALKREDINYCEGVMIVRRIEIKYRLPETRKYAYDVMEYKGNDVRVIPLTDEILDQIMLIDPGNENDYLFEIKGRRITSDSLSRRLRKVCRDAGINVKKPVAVRMAYAAHALIDGVDMEHILNYLDIKRN